MSTILSRIALRRSLVEVSRNASGRVGLAVPTERRYLQSLSTSQPLMEQRVFDSNSVTFHRLFSSTKSDDNDTEAKKDETESAESTQKDEDIETETSEETGQNEVEALKEEIKNYKDQLLRSLAEQENIRRIAKRDVDSARSFSVSSFAKSLLETSDNLTRAMEAVPEEVRNDPENNAALLTLYEGIQMTDDGLNKAFEKHGLKKFGVQGEKFDPNKHEALFEYVDEKMEAGSIGQVMKVGFELNGRVIRSAEVGVTKKN